jgi:C-terminal processing protease CtpA/Prc
MAAMTYVNHADAVIFDLRDNRGGSPEMVQLVGAYLFDHPEYWYNPRENTTEQSWTRSPVPGSNLADKPLFVLTSTRTISGAEQFSYNLKMLKRATLIGETTGGAAHSGVFYRLDDHFGMGIPEVKAINPYSTNDWAEIGVEPDVRASANNALDLALKLARARLAMK